MLKSPKLLIGILTFILIQANVFADERYEGRHEGDRHGHREGWHGDIRHFHERDIELWRGGRWVHGWHAGRNAWWWTVGGVWYSYSAPVYPYPDPYLPPDIPGVIVQQPPVAAVPSNPPQANPPPTQPAQYWYYCSGSAGYYPYVPECPGGWQKVPANQVPQ